LELLAFAKDQLEVARLLGYAHAAKKTYEELANRIASLIGDVEEKRETEQPFEKLIAQIQEFLSKFRKEEV